MVASSGYQYISRVTVGSWLCVVLAGVAALIDWVAVARGLRRIELVAKPVVLALLVIAAALATPESSAVKPWLVTALALGLMGDTALLGAADAGRAGPARGGVTDNFAAESKAPGRFFLLGLVAFGLGHLSYLAAMLAAGVDRTSALFGLALAAVMIAGSIHRIVRGAYRAGGAPLAAAVIGYTIALGATVVLGVGTAILLVAYGSVLFAASDLVLGYDRFVRKSHWSRLTIIVMYHLAQFALLVGLTLSR